MINYNHSKQQGVYAVEFAIAGSLFFLLLFAVLEIGRLFFTWNVLTEVTRRGAMSSSRRTSPSSSLARRKVRCSTVPSGSAKSSAINCRLTDMVLSGFLISWASPAARAPMDSRCLVRRRSDMGDGGSWSKYCHSGSNPARSDSACW